MRYIEIDDDGRVVDGKARGRAGEELQRFVLALSPSKRGLIGQTAVINPGQTATLIDWQSDDDDSALPVTVYLGPPNTAIIQQDGPYTLEAIIQYGIGGAQHEVIVDVLPGMAITLPATFVRVDVRLSAGSANPVGVSALICRFSTPHPPPKRTLSVTGPLVIAPLSFPVPAQAHSVRLFVVPAAPAGAPWRVRVLYNDGLTPLLSIDFPAGTNQSGQILLPGNCSSIEVSITGGAVNINITTAIFDIY